MASTRYLEATIPRPRAVWATVLAVGLLWLLLLKELAVDWNINPQYGYGWGVPPLLLYLFWKRWLDRPSPATERAGPVFWGTCVVLAFSVLPLRLVQEANPDWRLLSWLFTSGVVALSSCGVYYAGGWPWVRHFVPVLLFIFLSVPWPGGIEHGVSQALMRGVTAVTAEAMNWLGKGAAAQGNVIMLATGGVGVTEACSGIRSFQTSFMLAFFFGELYRLPRTRRLFVLLLGLAAAVVLNVIRAFSLTWLCAQWGPEVENIWHDRLGLAMLVGTVAVIWALVRIARRSRATANGTSAIDHPGSEIENRQSQIGNRNSRSVPGRIALLLALWCLCAEGFVQAWYRGHEGGALGETAAWSVQWPLLQNGFQESTLPAETRQLLRCDESQSGHWVRADGAEWTMFFLRWRPGRMSAQLAKGHTPDVCLPANGFRQVAERGRTVLRTRGFDIPFNTYVYTANGQIYHVFFAQVDDRRSEQEVSPGAEATTYLEGLEPAQRLRAVRQGRRHAGHQVLEIAMTGYATQAAAQQALQDELPRLIAPGRN